MINEFLQKKIQKDFHKIFQIDFYKIFQMDFNILRWAQRALLLGPKGSTVAADGCSPPQDQKKAPVGRQFF